MSHRVGFVVSAYLLSFSAVVLTSAPPAAAQMSADPCADALVETQIRVNGQYSHDVRLASYVSKKVWDDEFRTGGAAASLFGITVGNSYADYQNRVDQEMQLQTASLSDSQAFNMLFVGLTKENSTAYAACWAAHVDQYGLHMVVVGATQRDITVMLKWLPQGRGEPRTIPLSWIVPPKLISYGALPTHTTQGTQDVIFARPVDQETVAVKYPGFSDSVVLTPLPPPLPQGPPDRELYTIAAPGGPYPIIASVIANNTHYPDQNKYPEKICYRPPPGDALVIVNEDPYPGTNPPGNDTGDTHGGAPYCNPGLSCMPSSVRCWDIRLLQGCAVSKRWLAWYRVWAAAHNKQYDPAYICDPNAGQPSFKALSLTITPK